MPNIWSFGDIILLSIHNLIPFVLRAYSLRFQSYEIYFDLILNLEVWVFLVNVSFAFKKNCVLCCWLVLQMTVYLKLIYTYKFFTCSIRERVMWNFTYFLICLLIPSESSWCIRNSVFRCVYTCIFFKYFLCQALLPCVVLITHMLNQLIGHCNSLFFQMFCSLYFSLDF